MKKDSKFKGMFSGVLNMHTPEAAARIKEQELAQIKMSQAARQERIQKQLDEKARIATEAFGTKLVKEIERIENEQEAKTTL